MKKALICGLSLALTLSLAACAAPGQGAPAGAGTPPAATEPADTGTPEPQETPTPEPQEAPADPEPEETAAPEPEETPADPEPEETAAPEPTEPEPAWSFTPVNETVYATAAVNLREGFGTDTDKVGALARGQSITRTGIGAGDADGWSEVELDGRKVYVSSSYVSTEKPAVRQSTPGASGQTSTGGSQSTPSSSQSSSSGSSGGDSVIPPPPSGERPTDLIGVDSGDFPEMTDEQKQEWMNSLARSIQLG